MAKISFNSKWMLVHRYIRTIFDDLYELVRYGRLPEIQAYIEKRPVTCLVFPLLLNYKEEKLSLLMLATLNGHLDLVKMMLTCNNLTKGQIEQEGSVYNRNGRIVRNVTALWCALEGGHFQVAHVLIHLAGANTNHGPNHPLLFDAIQRARVDIVYYLVENGYAEINRIISNDSFSVSCLCLSVILGHAEIAKYLIARGADVNYREFHYTPASLKIAAKAGNLEMVHILCMAGANTKLRSATGKTALMMAAKCGHYQIVEYLLQHTNDEETLDDLELTAASIMVSDMDMPLKAERTFRLLHRAFKSRVLWNKPKIVIQPIAAYDYQRECQSIDELNSIRNNSNRLFIEALLIRERVLLPRRNKKLFKPLQSYAIVLAERAEFTRSLDLLIHTFYLYQQMGMETGLHRFVWIFSRMIIANVLIDPDQFLSVCRLVFEPSQSEMLDKDIKNSLCLIVFSDKVLRQSTLNDAQRHSIIQWIKDVCRIHNRTSDGQTLLHLSVNRRTYYDISYRPVDIKTVLTFPNLVATKLLISFGRKWIDIDSIETNRGDTALHLIAKSFDSGNIDENKQIIELLIRTGAHIDCINADGLMPVNVTNVEDIRILLQSAQKVPKLKCFCARRVIDKDLPYKYLWPMGTNINKFVCLHGELKRKRTSIDDDEEVWSLVLSDFS